MMKTVHVLSHHSRQSAFLSKLDDRLVSAVGLDFRADPPQLTVEMHLPSTDTEILLLAISIDGEVIGVDLFPETVGSSKIGDAGLRAETGTSENQDLVGRFEHLGCIAHKIGHDHTV